MSETTTRLRMPYIMPAQAQKHVTHNEALAAVDVLVQSSAVSRTVAAPPTAAEEGTAFLVPAGPSGAWAGHAGALAAFDDGAWRFFAPREGWRCWVADEKRLVVHTGGGWQALAGGGDAVRASMVGIGMAPDAVNRLAVKSDAALFSHDDVTPGTGDIRITLNKSAAGRDAGLVFQTGYSSRALLGTFGSDAIVLKVSADGGSFSSVLSADPGGKVALLGAVAPGLAQPVQLNGAVRVAADLVRVEAASTTGVSLQLANTQSGAHGGYTLSATGGGTFVLADAQNGPRLVVGPAGAILPGADNTVSLGEAGKRFSAVYAATGVIQTSDARDKAEAEPIAPDLALALLEAIEPVTFRWRDGAGEAADDAEGGDRRRHAGFLAQDVRAGLDAAKVDLAVWGRDGGNDGRQWLRLDQMTAILWAALRETRREIATLRGAVSDAGRLG